MRINEAALWDRRDETTHPAPIGYMLESRFSLTTPMDELMGRLGLLGRREAQLDSVGVTCHLKDLGEMSCSACPVHEVGQDTDKSVLCRLGREQERLSALVITKANF